MFIIGKQCMLAICISITIATLSPAEASGQQDEEINGILTANKLAEWVLEANPSLVSIQAAADAAAHRIEPAGSLDDPVLSYATAPATIGSGRLNQKIDFSQQLPWPGTLRARKEIARNEARAVDYDVDILRLNIISQAKAAFAEWRFIDEALNVHHEAKNLLNELIGTTQTRYAAGEALKQDALQAEVERANLDNDEFRLKTQQTILQARINALLNRSMDVPLPEAASTLIRPIVPGPRVLEDRALAQHPELASLEARLLAERSRITLAEKDFYPNFRFSVGYNGLWDSRDKRAVLGVSLNIPLNRGKRKSELSSAQAEMRRAEWTLIDRRSALLADISQARAEVIEAQNSITLYEGKLVPLSQEYLAATIADYESGAGAFLNVIAAEQRVLDTGLALARARADYARRLAELERATGGEFASTHHEQRESQR